VLPARASLPPVTVLHGRERRALWQGFPKLRPRADAELGEHVVEVPFHGPGAQEEHASDLGVRKPVARKAGNLALLRCEVAARLVLALAHRFAGCKQLAAGALAECLHAELGEHVVRDAKLVARVDSAALAPQPLSIEEMGPRELASQTGEAQVLDGLAVKLLGGVAVADERS
jgi:hypothetical protein